MSSHRTRRALLAGLGVVTIAGCTATNPTRRSTPEDDLTLQNDPEPPTSINSDWPMPAHDPGLSSGASDASGPTEPISVLWEASAETALSAPIVTDETLYVGANDGVVSAFDARTGTDRWQQSVGTTAHTPWALDGRLYVPTETAIVALDASDGSELWRVDTPGRADIVNRAGEVEQAAVLVAPRGVYWLSDDGPTVVNLARNDGSEHWRTAIDDPWTRRLFAGDDALFVSTDHNGRVPWTLDATSGDLLDGPAEAGADFADERFYRDGKVYSVDQMFGRIDATAVDDQGQSWDQSLPPGSYASSAGPDYVYTSVTDGQEPGLYALSTKDGRQAWSVEFTSEITSRPVVADDSVLVQTDDRLRCFDPVDGTQQWAHPATGIGDRLVVADDLLYTTVGATVRAFR